MQTIELKVMVLGPKLGKSTFIKSITNNNNNNNIGQTLGCDVTPYEIFTNNGKRRLNLWEVGSQIQGLKDKYCLNSDLAIIFRGNNNHHLEFENWLPSITPKIYVDNYDIYDNDNIIDNIKNTIIQYQL